MKDPDVIHGDFTWGELLLALVAVFLLCALSSGCGQEMETTRVSAAKVWTDGAVTPAIIARGCSAWTAIGVSCEVVADRASANVVVESSSTTKALGLEYPRTFPVLVQIGTGYPQDDDMLATTVAHEIGHALGMVHIDTGPAVMNTTATLYNLPVLTDVDLAGWGALSQ